MKLRSPSKKEWIRPAYTILEIKKDTFGGTAGGPEKKPTHMNKKPV